MIENVGNLVCPAAYDLGESLRVVLLSVTEGEDKPLKYPAPFHSADVVVITKVDLAEACDFDGLQAHHHIERVAPHARIRRGLRPHRCRHGRLVGALGRARVTAVGESRPRRRDRPGCTWTAAAWCRVWAFAPWCIAWPTSWA